MLWKDEQTPLVGAEHRRRDQAHARRHAARPRPWPTARAGSPSPATRRASCVVLPLHPGMELDVREHAFLVASHTIQYSFVRIKGLANVLHGGGGMYMDRFVTARAHPGLLLLHGNGNVLRADAAAGREDPGRAGRLPLQGLHGADERGAAERCKTGLLRHGMYLAEMTGPGRVGIQSMYVHHHSE